MSNLWEVFGAQTDAAPCAPALIFGETITSFAELRDLAQRCADEITARGIGKGDVVALHLPKRVVTYALLLACLRIGAPYVFIDPQNPAERTTRIFARVNPTLIFSLMDLNCPSCPVVRVVDGDETAWIGSSPSNRLGSAPSISGADPAYIMFTSGSTGEPKGAVIPHQGVLSLIAWARAEVLMVSDERFTAINPLHFDNSVFDIYCGLFNGAALVPVETGEITNPIGWLKIIRGGAASVMFAVPTLFLILAELDLLTPQSLPSVRTFVFGGEGFPIGKLREFQTRFSERARLINVYGPTETSCICSSVNINPDNLSGPDDEFPPLGHIHKNFSYAILDDELVPVGPGRPGELWLGGPCVGLGYYNNAEETAVRFRQDPRHNRFRAIYYRTGDLVLEDFSGQLWFHGRVDNQVKIRGYRIELEEVDLAVQAIPGVWRALSVVVSGDDGDELGVLFVADHSIENSEVRAWCAERLPHYMRPACILQIDALPLNANGKIDRRAAVRMFQATTVRA